MTFDTLGGCSLCGNIGQIIARGVVFWESSMEIPSKDELYEMYITRKMATRKMGRHYHVSKFTISKWLKSFDIQLRSANNSVTHRGKEPPSSEELYRLVYIENLPYREIAPRYNCHESMIGRWLDKYGIPRPGSWQARTNAAMQELTKENLIDLYENRGYSTCLIAEIYKTSPHTIQQACRKHGVELRPDGWNETRLVCSDGHKVRSTYEFKVDNWLHEHRMEHIYDPRLPFARRFMADFLANGWYIEIWGVIGSARYKARKQRKVKMYKAHNMPLIEIPAHAFDSHRNHQWKRLLSQCLQATAFSMLPPQRPK